MSVVSESVPLHARIREALVSYYTSENLPEFRYRREALEGVLLEAPDAYYQFAMALYTIEDGRLMVYAIQADGLPTHPDKPIVDLREAPCGD